MFKIIKWVTIAGALSVANYLVFGKYGIIVPVSISGVLLLGLFLFQNKLLYMPDIPNMPHSPQANPQGYRHPSDQGLETENVEIATADNMRIKGWLVRSDNSERILIYFHQNAGNLGFRIPFIKNLHERTNSDILLVAYRGFSDSDGKPTEGGLQLDAQAIMTYAMNYRARQLAGGRTKSIFILGRSLGGAVSIYLASLEVFKNEIKGLILENTFTSIQDMVAVLFPPLAKLEFMHRNFWPSKLRISSIETPTLFVRSLKDEIVPTIQMQQLIGQARNLRMKMEHQIPQGTHNVAWQVDPPAYFGKINEFFKHLK